MTPNWKQETNGQGWNSALSFGTKDKQSTIASFSVCLTGKDDDDDDDKENVEQKSTFGVSVFKVRRETKTCASVSYPILSQARVSESRR